MRYTTKFLRGVASLRLPTEAASGGLLLPIQAWIDDSGGKGQSPVFVFAGWIGKAEDWANFSDDWVQCLSSRPKIKYLKMREAASRTGQFEGMLSEFRNKKLRDLAKVITKYEFSAYWYISDMEAFSDILAKFYRPPHSNYYFWAYMQTMMGIAYGVSSEGHDEKIEIIFDEQEVFSPEAKSWYPKIRRSLRQGAEQNAIARRIFQVMPTKPLFRDDIEFVPLQAADMLAWSVNRSLRTENPFLWLWEEEFFGQVKISAGSQVVDRTRMEKILDSAYEDLNYRLLASGLVWNP